MNTEKTYSPMSGYVMAAIILVCLIIGIGGFVAIRAPFFILLVIASILLMPGFFFVNPNSSVVLVLFGDYKGTVKSNGFYWVNPFFSKKSISLRARNFDSEKIIDRFLS